MDDDDDKEKTKIVVQPPQNQAEIINELLDLKAVPKDLQLKFWAFLDRSHALTFYNEGDEKRLMNHFEIQKMYLLLSVPFGKYTPELEIQLQQIKMIFRNRIKMSVGTLTGANTKVNNRSLLTTQISQSFVQKPNEDSGAFLQKIGIVKR